VWCQWPSFDDILEDLALMDGHIECDQAQKEDPLQEPARCRAETLLSWPEKKSRNKQRWVDPPLAHCWFTMLRRHIETVALEIMDALSLKQLFLCREGVMQWVIKNKVKIVETDGTKSTREK
jgi:hypothetical protein